MYTLNRERNQERSDLNITACQGKLETSFVVMNKVKSDFRITLISEVGDDSLPTKATMFNLSSEKLERGEQKQVTEKRREVL